MNKRSNYLFKNVGILAISNFASKFLVFLLVPLYTGVLSTEEYGTYDIIVSTVTLLYPILTLNIVDAVMRFLMDKCCSKESVATIGIKYIMGSMLIVAVCLTVVRQLNLWDGIRGLELYVFLYYASYVLNQFFIQFAKGLEKVTDMGVSAIISTAVMLGANILLLIVFRRGLNGFFEASIISQTSSVVYFIFRIKIWKYIRIKKTDKSLKTEMLLYCTPLIATALGWWINSTSDKYVVTIMCGVAVNGVFSVAYKMPQIINTLQSIFIQAWQISAIKEYGNDDSASFYGSAFIFINLLMVAACAVMILLTKPLAKIMYANEFYSAWRYVPALLISCVINSASGFLGPILSGRKDSRAMALSAVYGAVANVVMNIVFVHFVGAQGATVATVIASLIIYIVRKRAVGDDLKIENYGRVLLTWMLLCVQACIEIFTQLWYLEVIIILMMAVINKSEIELVLKRIFKYGKQKLLQRG